MKDVDKLKLLESIILSKRDLLKDYKLIGFFGSCINSDNFFDIDLVTIGKNKTHQILKNEIKKDFLKNNLKVVLFKTIKKQPLSKKDDEILIHDLHYSNLQDLYKKEWKDIINEIKNSTRVIYGSKSEIKEIVITEQYFYSLWLDWCRKIASNEDYSRFKKYLKKVIPKVYLVHPKLNLKDKGDKILKIIENESWAEGKEKVIEILQN